MNTCTCTRHRSTWHQWLVLHGELTTDSNKWLDLTHAHCQQHQCHNAPGCQGRALTNSQKKVVPRQHCCSSSHCAGRHLCSAALWGACAGVCHLLDGGAAGGARRGDTPGQAGDTASCHLGGTQAGPEGARQLLLLQDRGVMGTEGVGDEGHRCEAGGLAYMGRSLDMQHYRIAC